MGKILSHLATRPRMSRLARDLARELAAGERIAMDLALTRRREADTALAQRLEERRAVGREVEAAAVAELEEQLGQLRELAAGACGVSAAAWDSPLWTPGPEWPRADPTLTPLIRLGTHVDDLMHGLPALAGVAGVSHLCVEAGAGDREEALALIESAVTRTLAGMPGRAVTTRVFDPIGLGDSLPAVLWGKPAATTEAEFGALLGQLRIEIASGAQRTHQLIVLLDFPYEAHSRQVEVIRNLAGRNPSRGTTLIVHRDPDAALRPETAELLGQIRTSCLLVHRHGSSWGLGAATGLVFEADPVPPAAARRRLVDHLRRPAPTPTFAAVVDRETFAADSTDGVRAPFGLREDGPLELELSDRRPHALIAGATGRGKSNLLHVVIGALALGYAPEDLALHLVDLKDGTEFNSYVASGLPHLTAAGVRTGGSGLTLARTLLGDLQAQIEGRARLFIEAGVSDYAAYRRTATAPLPRVVAVIDEFHRLLQGPHRHEGFAALQDILRRGRSFGVHLLLATQTLGSMLDDGTELLRHIDTRITFALETAGESLRVLGSEDAIELKAEGPGVIAINADHGAPQMTRRGLVAIKDLEGVAARIAQALPDQPAAVCREPTAEETSPPDDFVILGEALGLAGAAEGVRLLGRRSQNVVVVGTDEQEACAVLCSAASSLVRGCDAGRLVLHLLDAEVGDAASATLAALAGEAAEHGHEVHSYVGEAGLTEATSALQDRLAAGSDGVRHILVAAGADQLEGFEDRQAAKAFRDLLLRGPRAGIHVLAWWEDPRELAARLFPPGGARPFRHVLVLSSCSRGPLSQIARALEVPVPAGTAALFDNQSASEPRIIAVAKERS